MIGNRGYSVADIAPIAVAFVIIGIVVSMGALIMTNMISSSYTDTAIVNETHASGGSLPETVTVSHIDGGLKSGTDTIYVHDADTSSDYLLTRGTNYTVISYDTGQFNITSCPYINSTSDQYKISYTYQANTTATSTLNTSISALKDFSSWFSILVIIIIAAIIIGIVMKYFGGFERRPV